MNIRWDISQHEAGRFVNMCEAVIRNVGNGSKAATEEACKSIMNASLEQVPIDTGTLASTADYKVERRGDVKGYRYEGVVGYAGATVFGANLSSASRAGIRKEFFRESVTLGARITDAPRGGSVNPKTGLPASAYAAIVHEDLGIPHPRGGKAKFLEDPVRDFASAKFKRVAEEYWRWAIEWVWGNDYTYGRARMVRKPAYARVKLTPGQLGTNSTNRRPL